MNKGARMRGKEMRVALSMPVEHPSTVVGALMINYPFGSPFIMRDDQQVGGCVKQRVWVGTQVKRGIHCYRYDGMWALKGST